MANTDICGALSSDIYRYWYFEHLGNNEYAIKSMAKKSQVLAVQSSSSSVLTLSEASGSYPSTARWTVSRGSYGYVFVNKANSNSLRVNPSHSLSYVANTQTGDPCAYLVAETGPTAYMSFDCWRLTSCVDMQSIGIEDGSYYYIFNGYSKLYMTVETNASGQNIYGRSFSNSPNRRWKVIAQDDLTYQIENMNDSKVLNVVSDLDLTMSANYKTSNQKFTIERIDSGDYQGLYYIRFDSYYLTLSISTMEVYLSPTPDLRSQWSFSRVTKQTASLYNFDYYQDYANNNPSYHFDTAGTQADFEDWAELNGYNSVALTNNTYDNAYNSLLNSDVFVFSGHGNPGRIAFMTTGNVATGRIFANSAIAFGPQAYYCIDMMEDNALSSLRCVLLLGCNTGISTNGYNLVDAIYNKGAHFVLGTTETIITSTSDLFLARLIEALNTGVDIESACMSAIYIDEDDRDEYEYEYRDESGVLHTTYVFPCYKTGDEFQTLS